METTITLNTEICRICEETNYLINLFDPNNIHLYNKLKEIENVQQDNREYQIYDNMFKYICTSCENSIEGYYEFKTQCKNTRTKLVTAATCGIFANQTQETVIIIDEVSQEQKNLINDAASNSSMEVIEYAENPTNYDPQQESYIIPDDDSADEVQPQEEPSLKIVSVCGQADADTESSGSKLVLCNICNKRVTARSFERHKNRHEQRKIFECTECFKTFLSKKSWIAHLKDHVVTHKEYQCDKCDKSFSLLSHLKTHQLVHPEERIYECSMCERSFSRLANLKGHMTRIHRIDISAIDHIQ